MTSPFAYNYDKLVEGLAEAVGLPAESTDRDLLDRVRALAKLEKQAELVELANTAARLPRQAILTSIAVPEGVEALINGEPAKPGQVLRSGDRLGYRGTALNPRVSITYEFQEQQAMDLWRTLLDLADAAGGGRIDAVEWRGICDTMYALLREAETR